MPSDSVFDDGQALSHCCSYFSIETFNDKFDGDSDAKLFIFHHNIRSFRRNYSELAVYLDLLKSKFHVLVLTETWFCSDGLLDNEGYKAYHSVRSDRVGGGVSVFVLNSLKSYIIQPLTVNSGLIETCCVRILNDRDSFLIFGIYRPPGFVEFDLFIDGLHELVNDFNVSGEIIYMLGDFNVNLMTADSNATLFVDMMRSLSFLPLIDVPTRVTDSSESLIDNIWTNQLSSVTTGVLTFDITDHYPIFAVIPVRSPDDKILKSFRDHSACSLSKLECHMKQYASGIDLSCVIDFDVAMNQFVSSFLNIYKNKNKK